MSDPVANTYRQYKPGISKLTTHLIHTAQRSDKNISADLYIHLIRWHCGRADIIYPLAALENYGPLNTSTASTEGLTGFILHMIIDLT